METESERTNTKISDSGYANSCSNSHSQRSASSKSQHSGSNSSRSSGYCGGTTTTNENTGSQISKRNKDKEHKKQKVIPGVSNGKITLLPEGIEPPLIEKKQENLAEPVTMGLETLPVKVEAVNQSTEISENVVENVAPHSPIDLISASNKIPEVSHWPLENDKELSLCNKENVELKKTVPKLSDKKIQNLPGNYPENGFCCVVSMYDGVVLYTTASLTKVLGFPKDMWLGRSFIDFVHPKDKETFSHHVTAGVAIPLVNCPDVKSSFFVCLRKYRGLKSSGYAVVEKVVSYQAFKLTVTFKKLMDIPEGKLLDNGTNFLLVVLAAPVCGIYKEPNESTISSKFGMRHTSDCTFSHVDPDVVLNFGFLPQDIIGKSVFDFYHPADMQSLKESYKNVIQKRQITDSVFKSKPYRFAVQNGGFAVVETEWSIFVNPWSKRLEFVVGSHRVLKGPKNPDIFASPSDDEKNCISDDTIQKSKIIQGEILLLLNKEMSPPNQVMKHEVSKRCNDLANFMESLMNQVKSNLQLDLPQYTDPTISERDSVMLGEISPHHDYYDSKSSSETPPSYNQLNYNENIKRFFESKPKTTISDGSDDRSMNQNNPIIDLESETKMCSFGQEGSNNQKCISPLQNSGTSGSGSAGMLSTESNPILECRTISAVSNDSYKPPHLTEKILLQHNEVMEQMMIKKHKKTRHNTKENKKHVFKNEKNYNLENYHHFEKPSADNEVSVLQSQGVKRSGSHSLEGESHKMSKYKHLTGQLHQSNNQNSKQNSVHQNDNHLNMVNQSHVDNFHNAVETNDPSLWPPFSVTVTPITNTQTSNVTSATGMEGYATGMFPVYYIPTQRHISGDYFDPSFNNPQPYQVQYLPGMIYNYNPIFPASPIMCSPLPIVPLPVPPTITSISQDNTRSSNIRLNNAPMTTNSYVKPSPASVQSTSQVQRPASQATSVKAEPGSALGSIASASIANKALSECSRKDLGLQSVCSPDSPVVSPSDFEGEMENLNFKKNFYQRNVINQSKDFKDNTTIDEGSSYYSSSYSSFFKTDAGSGSNDDYTSQTNKTSNNNCWKSKPPSIKKSDPPWLKAVDVTPDIIYRYQMTVKGLEDVLEADLKTLKHIKQPSMVNDQLNQLYLEMELDGLSKYLALEEGVTSSSSSDENVKSKSNQNRSKKKRRSYNSLVMIYEENAPLPPADS